MIVGKKQTLFTNVPKKEQAKLKKFGDVSDESVLDMEIKNACLLDPQAAETLTPEEAQTFDAFIFGGILGDAPVRGRTKKLLTSKMKNVMVRNLGKEQMSTDNAVLTTWLIIGGKKLEEIPFQDTIEVTVKKGRMEEAFVLPFRYVLVKGKPFMSQKLKKYIQQKESL